MDMPGSTPSWGWAEPACSTSKHCVDTLSVHVRVWAGTETRGRKWLPATQKRKDAEPWVVRPLSPEVFKSKLGNTMEGTQRKAGVVGRGPSALSV